MFDWDDLRFFLAIARYRTVHDAATHLNVTRSAVNKRLASLQETMGVQLVRRILDSYVLTVAGESIRNHAERVEAETLSMQRALAGTGSRISGTVRVAGTSFLMDHLLAPAFAGLHASHRGILIEALPDRVSEPPPLDDLDVLVRLRCFDQPGTVVRSIGTVGFGLYGCVEYLSGFGEPDVKTGCPGHQVIALLDDDDFTAQAAWLTDNAGRARVVVRTDSYETQLWAATHAGGLALLPRFRADAEPSLRRVETGNAIPSAEIWLGVQRDKRHIPSVRTVLDCIRRAVRDRAEALDPEFSEALLA